jgi:hypothetical protein
MVKRDDILTLLYWRDETNDRRKANVIQRVIDKMMIKLKEQASRGNTIYSDGIAINQAKIELSKLMLTVRLKGLNLGW